MLGRITTPTHRSPRELKTKTQSKAYKLLSQEELKAKRSRLECLLIQQFISKYGAKSSSFHLVIHEMIKREVKKFVNSYENVLEAESMIFSLEAQVHANITAMKTKVKNDNNEIKKREEQKRDESSARIRAAEEKSSEINMKSDWPVINAILAAEEEEKKRVEHRVKTEHKMAYQRELRDQIQKNKSRSVVVFQEKQQAGERNKEVQQELKKEQLYKEVERGNDRRSERDMRFAQIEENTKKREVERQIRVDQEKAEMARSRRKAEQEKDDEERRREKLKKAQDDLFVENEHNKVLKLAQKMKRDEEEKKMNAAYEAKLEREENERKRIQTERLHALQEAAKKTLAETFVSTEEKSLMNQAEIKRIQDKERAENNKEASKKNRLRADLLDAKEFNKIMADKKRDEKLNERAADRRRREQMMYEAEEDKMKDERKMNEKKERMKTMKYTLDNQIVQRKEVYSKQKQLSQVELDVNKSIINKMQQDPKLMQRVHEKVQPVPLGSLVGRNSIF